MMNPTETYVWPTHVFSGRTVRAVCYRGDKVFFEQFFLIMGDALALPDSRHLGLFGPKQAKAAELVDGYDFADQPKAAPALVYERKIISSVSAETFLDEYFRGSGPSHQQTPPAQWVDLSGIEPMPLADFWELIHGSELGNVESAGQTMLEIADRLGALPESELFRFQRRLAQALTALDHPANAVRSELEAGGTVVSADASLYFRCRVVLAGRDIYASLLSSPGVESLPKDAPGGEELLSVATEALSARGHNIQFTGDPSYETGTNTELWGPAPALPPRPAVTAPMDALASRQYTLDLMASFNYPVDGDPWADAQRAFAFFTARIALKTADGFAERVYLYPIHFGESALDPLTVLVEELSDAVLEVDGPRPANALALPDYGLLLHAIFRPGMTIEEYRQRIIELKPLS